jgi:hypothetical protein
MEVKLSVNYHDHQLNLRITSDIDFGFQLSKQCVQTLAENI